MNSVVLYSYKSVSIKVTIEAYFNDMGNLVVDGYDIGSDVEAYFGDSDYEYNLTIPATEVQKLYSLLSVPDGDKAALLTSLQERFNTNHCYSQIQEFLSAHGVAYESFSWT